MIKIHIHSSVPEHIKYTSKKTGQPAELFKQFGYAFLVNEHGEAVPYPEKFGFLLDRGAPPFPTGEYTLHPSGFYVKDETLHFRTRLAPVKASRPAVTA